MIETGVPTVMDKDFVALSAVGRLASVALAVKVEVPAAVGVPEIAPVAGSSVRPAGNVPSTWAERVQTRSSEVTDPIKGFGQLDPDTLRGGEGNDQMAGGDDADDVNGGSGPDKLFGDAGQDQLNGDAGDDEIEGNGQDDSLGGGDGNDSLDGGPHLEGDFCDGEIEVRCEF